MTAATSASDRYAAARQALAAYDADPKGRARENAMHDCIGALRALIEPPATAETPREIAERVAYEQAGNNVIDACEAAVRAGIQAAWDSWECSCGDFS